jgi:hypothetical protein
MRTHSKGGVIEFPNLNGYVLTVRVRIPILGLQQMTIDARWRPKGECEGVLSIPAGHGESVSLAA